MTFELMYWHWIVAGIALMLFEIFIPSLTILWFGAGAVLVGLVLLVFPALSVTGQVVLWSIFSVLLTIFWFRYLKPLWADKTKAGLSKEAIVGEVGQVLTLPDVSKRGTLRFPAPVLGSDEWLFICRSDDPLAIGDRVRVVDVSGNSLIVVKQ